MWVSSNEVDEPTACYAEWGKSEREKQKKLGTTLPYDPVIPLLGIYPEETKI